MNFNRRIVVWFAALVVVVNGLSDEMPATSVTATTRAAPMAATAMMAPKARPADRFTVDGVDMGSPGMSSGGGEPAAGRNGTSEEQLRAVPVGGRR